MPPATAAKSGRSGLRLGAGWGTRPEGGPALERCRSGLWLGARIESKQKETKIRRHLVRVLAEPSFLALPVLAPCPGKGNPRTRTRRRDEEEYPTRLKPAGSEGVESQDLLRRAGRPLAPRAGTPVPRGMVRALSRSGPRCNPRSWGFSGGRRGLRCARAR